jgi:hypothetical protein
MSFTAFDYAMWLGGAVLHLTILTIMARRKLLRELPVFSAYVIFSLATSIATFVIHETQGYAAYFYAFWSKEAVLNLLMFGVVYEVNEHVFKNYVALRRLGTLLFWSVGLFLLLLAMFTAVSSPSKGASQLVTGIATLERSVLVIQVGLLLFVVLFAGYFKLSWRHCIFGLALGFGIYAALQLIAVSLRAHLGDSANLIWGKGSVLAYAAGAIVWTKYLSVTESTIVELRGPQKEELEKWNQALTQLLYR